MRIKYLEDGIMRLIRYLILLMLRRIWLIGRGRYMGNDFVWIWLRFRYFMVFLALIYYHFFDSINMIYINRRLFCMHCSKIMLYHFQYFIVLKLSFVFHRLYAFRYRNLNFWTSCLCFPCLHFLFWSSFIDLLDLQFQHESSS